MKEKEKYMSPVIEVVGMETEEIMAMSQNLGGNTGTHSGAANGKQRDFWEDN